MRPTKTKHPIQNMNGDQLVAGRAAVGTVWIVCQRWIRGECDFGASRLNLMGEFAEMQKTPEYQEIPTSLTTAEFERFIWPHIPKQQKGPKGKLSWHSIFNYILTFLYLGCQWKMLPIAKDATGKPEIHYSNIHRRLSFLEKHGVLDAVFEASVQALHQAKKLDVSVIHGDGTSTAAKKGGDNLGRNGHKHFKGDKVVPFCDRNCNVISPFVAAAGNANESPLFRDALPKAIALSRRVGFNLKGSIVSLDGAYDGKQNRKMIFNHGMVPNIPENVRNRKKSKPGPKRLFNPLIQRTFSNHRANLCLGG